MKREFAVLAGMLAVFAGCGSDDECQVPDGTYDFTVIPETGTCPDDVVNTFVAGLEAELSSASMSIGDEEDDNKCETSSFDSDSTDADGCRTLVSGSSEKNADGVQDAALAVSWTCPDGSLNCSHNFTVRFEEQ